MRERECTICIHEQNCIVKDYIDRAVRRLKLGVDSCFLFSSLYQAVAKKCREFREKAPGENEKLVFCKDCGADRKKPGIKLESEHGGKLTYCRGPLEGANVCHHFNPKSERKENEAQTT